MTYYWFVQSDLSPQPVNRINTIPTPTIPTTRDDLNVDRMHRDDQAAKILESQHPILEIQNNVPRSSLKHDSRGSMDSSHSEFQLAISMFLPWLQYIDMEISSTFISDDESVFSMMNSRANDTYKVSESSSPQTAVSSVESQDSMAKSDQVHFSKGSTDGILRKPWGSKIARCKVNEELDISDKGEGYPDLRIGSDLKLSLDALHAIEKLICPLKLSKKLKQKISFSLAIIITALKRYNRIGVSFNGGKDSVVMMNLVSFACYLLNLSSKGETNARSKVTVFHLKESHSFQELDTFIEQFKRDHIILENGFSFETFEYTDMMKGERGTDWDCIILGVRKSDYDDRIEEQKKLRILCPTTGDWPKMMRVHPILFWDYADIWDFTRELQLPFCSLYEYGYTSIGKTVNTRPNPYLSIKGEDENEPRYKPAWELTDGSLERAGRGTFR